MWTYNPTFGLIVQYLNKPSTNRTTRQKSEDDDTGEDLTHIYNKVTKKHMKLKRVGKVWILDVTVAADYLATNSSVFSRPGP